MRLAAPFVILGFVLSAIATPVRAGVPETPPAQEPAGKKAEDPPIPIFLNAPSDRDALLKLLGRPDMVILDGEAYRKLRQSLEDGKAPRAQVPPAVALAVVESVAVTGDVAGDWARLIVEFRVAMAVDGPTWVPIHLDHLTLSQVRELDRDLLTRQADNQTWQVELRGPGEHNVRVECLVPVRSTAEGKRLELAIPTAASTRFSVKVPGTVLDASTGVTEPVIVAAIDGAEASRLSARVGPRARLDLTWREPVDSSSRLPDLLSAQGEIALEIEGGSIKSRSSWTLSAIRGSANELKVRIDPTEEVLEVAVDDRPVQVETRRDGGRQVVTIPLADPIRLNSSRGLVLTTRRPIITSGAARILIQGYPFDQARVQTGMMAISKPGPLFLLPTAGRGLRRIDPRTELRESLRTRGDTALAFEFNEQPFDLVLDVEPSPARLRVESRTTVTVDSRTAKVDTRLDCRSSQGRTFDVRVALPKGLDFLEAGPADVIATPTLIPAEARVGSGRGSESPRILVLALDRQVKEPDVFTIHLKGSCLIDPMKPVNIPLFQPMADSSTGGRVAVVGERNVSIDPGDPGDEPSPFRVEWGLPWSDWDWPMGKRPGPEVGLLRFRFEGNPESLPMKVKVRPRSIHHESSMTATIDRKGAEVADEVACEVAFGALSSIEIALPSDVPGRWEVDGLELESRDPLGQDPDGTRRYRLKFAQDQSGSFRFRIRYRVPFAEPLTHDRASRLKLAPLRVLEGTSSGQSIKLVGDSALDLKAEGRGWSSQAMPEPSSSTSADPGPQVRLTLDRMEDKAGLVDVSVKAETLANLPRLVASRLWLRTIQRQDNDLATTAYYWIESRDGPVTIGLPAGSRLVQARLGRPESNEVKVEAAGLDAYRIRVPASVAAGPILVVIDYLIPSSAVSDRWIGPRLVDGVVQQSAWEVRLIGSRAGIGVPDGWTDENQWYWDGLLWRRRPQKSSLELAQWLTGGHLRYRITDPLESESQGGRHGYLFGRTGPPETLRFLVVSRLLLLLVCSGPVLLAGLLVLARRPPPRLLAGVALVIGFAVIGFADLNVTVLVGQSSILGVILFLPAMVMNWALERRGGVRPSDIRPAILGASSTEDSPPRLPSPGSDDSTAIRTRPVTSAPSTADHIILIRPNPQGQGPDDSSPTGSQFR